jgi:hypothetical protein
MNEEKAILLALEYLKLGPVGKPVVLAGPDGKLAMQVPGQPLDLVGAVKAIKEAILVATDEFTRMEATCHEE